MSEDIKFIIEKLEHIEKILTGDHGDNGLCGRVRVVEVERISTQKELTEHKNDHWKTFTLTIAGSGVFVAVITLLMRFTGR